MSTDAAAPRSRKPRSPRARTGRRVTIEDVAARAGVSTSAVSKVLRGAYGVSETMRANVTLVIDELGYRPHSGARAMRGRTFTIGVALTELSSPFQTEIAQCVATKLENSRYQELLIPAGVTTQQQQRAVEALLDHGVDGLILVAPHMPAKTLEDLASRVPTVCVDLHGKSSTFDSVCGDDAFGAKIMVDHLVELGHTRIAHTTQQSGADGTAPYELSHAKRLAGYVAAMKAHGLPTQIIESTYTETGGYQAAMEALNSADRPTALFAGADIAALGALRAADELDISVPSALTVVGYDDIDAASFAGIGLTTVDQSSEETGAFAAELLLDRLTGRSKTRYRLLEPRLVVRQTDGSPPQNSLLDTRDSSDLPGSSAES